MQCSVVEGSVGVQTTLTYIKGKVIVYNAKHDNDYITHAIICEHFLFTLSLNIHV